MSYCRWSSSCLDGSKSDLYMYDDVSGGITCHWKKNGGTYNFASRSETIKHINQMQEKGFIFPSYVYQTIKEDLIELGDTEELEPML